MESYQLSWIYGEFLFIGSWCFFVGFFCRTKLRSCACVCVCGCIMAGGLRVAPKRMFSRVIGAGNICMDFIKLLIAASVMTRYYQDSKRK